MHPKLSRLVLAAALALAVVVTGLAARGAAATPAETADDERENTGIEQHESVGTGGAILRLRGEPDAHIGVSIAETDATGEVRGARITGVRDDSPAAAAGLREGDVITQFDGERVRGARHLARLVSETPPGRSVAITVQRDGSHLDLQVAPEQRSASAWGERFGGRGSGVFVPPLRLDPDAIRERLEYLPGLLEPRRRLGLVTQSLSPQLAEYFGAREGVLVSTVRDDSPAARAGLLAGDVVTAVNGVSVSSPGELASAVARAEGDEVTVSYVRNREASEVKVPLPAREGSARPGRSRPA